MADRRERLGRAAAQRDAAEQELTQYEREIACFGGEQNAKSKSVITGLCAKNDKMLLQNVMNSWVGYFNKYLHTKWIHDKYKQQLEDANKKIFEYKLYQKNNANSVMSRRNMSSDGDLKREVFGIIKEWVEKEKEDRALADKIEATNAKLAGMQASQKENAKKSMMRVCSGHDHTLLDLCSDTWARWMAEERKNKSFNEAVKKEEAALKAYMDKKKGEAKAVLDKMTGSSDTGLIYQVFTEWAKVFADEKKGREMEELIEQQKSKFKTLNGRSKTAGYNTVSRANQLEDETVTMHVFMNWVCYAKIESIIRHFGGKMDKKRGQLEQVQSMFKSFATQLEQGIGTTPRRSAATQGSATRQPLPPQAA
jgi:hypothetical protein